MFVIYESKFGSLEEFVIKNEETNEFIAIIPSLGAVVRKIVLKCDENLYDVLHFPTTEEALKQDSSYPSALMFPFPGRIENGKYSFEGSDYQLAINDIACNNALHGIIYDKEFVFYDKNIIENELASLTFVYRYDGQNQGYPFPFEFYITYELNNEFGFHLKYEAKNTGNTALPMGFGWHPYFKILNQRVDELEISMDDVSDHVILNDKMIPEGKEMYDEEGYIPLQNQQLDDCYVVEPTGVGAYIELLCPATDQNLIVWQEAGKTKFSHLVLYIPPSRESIAIEPMTCGVNAFNTKEGLIILQPDQTTSGSIRVRFD